MGNQLCCEQQPKKQFDHTITVVHKQQQIRIPQLSPIVIQHLNRQKPFINQLPTKPTIKQYGNDIYQGKIDQRGRPNGYGKMYHKNGSVFIGQFFNGIADGQGHYVKNDGSYYRGKLRNNMANDQNGYYQSNNPQFIYRGNFVNNNIHGKGTLTTNDQNLTYQGLFNNGVKTDGKMLWSQGNKRFEYIGTFNNQGNFQGRGGLTQRDKGTYIGDFVNGYKHGRGQFTYPSGMKYIGQYYHGIKQGLGKIINKVGKVAYQGQFKNGMPHGKGLAPNQQGQLVERYWIDGLDKVILDQ